MCLLAFMLQTCMLTEPNDSAPGKVRFTFELKSANSANEHMTLPVLPEGISLLATIQTSDGEPMLELEKLNFYKENDHYVTQSLEFIPGDYVLTDLLLVDEMSDALFAIPQKGSALDGQVKQALDFSFTVPENAETTLRGELIHTLRWQASDFGYSSFNVQQCKKQTLKVIAGLSENGEFTPTTATAFIWKGNDTLKTISLSPGVNEITFQAAPGNTYTLVVIKDGFARFVKKFTFAALQIQRTKPPIVATLVPALTFIATPGPGESMGTQFDNTVWVEIDGFQGNISIDWGDGTVVDYLVSDYPEKRHNYADRGRYYISVTGDLHRITFFTTQNQGILRHINLMHLPNLMSAWFYFTQGLKEVDFSYNHNLNEIRFFRSNVEHINIPNDAPFYNVELNQSIYITVESLDALIDDLYYQAVSTNRTQYGFLYLSTFNEDEFIGPPSPAAMEKLRLLQNYGWEIVPDPDLF
jgi:hypothetical protein